MTIRQVRRTDDMSEDNKTEVKKADKRETLSNPSLRKNPMITDGPEAPVYDRSLGAYRRYCKYRKEEG